VRARARRAEPKRCRRLTKRRASVRCAERERRSHCCCCARRCAKHNRAARRRIALHCNDVAPSYLGWLRRLAAQLRTSASHVCPGTQAQTNYLRSCSTTCGLSRRIARQVNRRHRCGHRVRAECWRALLARTVQRVEQLGEACARPRQRQRGCQQCCGWCLHTYTNRSHNRRWPISPATEQQVLRAQPWRRHAVCDRDALCASRRLQRAATPAQKKAHQSYASTPHTHLSNSSTAKLRRVVQRRVAVHVDDINRRATINQRLCTQ
jgi:hypothetical protein